MTANINTPPLARLGASAKTNPDKAAWPGNPAWPRSLACALVLIEALASISCAAVAQDSDLADSEERAAQALERPWLYDGLEYDNDRVFSDRAFRFTVDPNDLETLIGALRSQRLFVPDTGLEDAGRLLSDNELASLIAEASSPDVNTLVVTAIARLVRGDRVWRSLQTSNLCEDTSDLPGRLQCIASRLGADFALGGQIERDQSLLRSLLVSGCRVGRPHGNRTPLTRAACAITRFLPDGEALWTQVREQIELIDAENDRPQLRDLLRYPLGEGAVGWTCSDVTDCLLINGSQIEARECRSVDGSASICTVPCNTGSNHCPDFDNEDTLQGPVPDTMCVALQTEGGSDLSGAGTCLPRHTKYESQRVVGCRPDQRPTSASRLGQVGFERLMCLPSQPDQQQDAKPDEPAEPERPALTLDIHEERTLKVSITVDEATGAFGLRAEALTFLPQVRDAKLTYKLHDEQTHPLRSGLRISRGKLLGLATPNLARTETVTDLPLAEAGQYAQEQTLRQDRQALSIAPRLDATLDTLVANARQLGHQAASGSRRLEYTITVMVQCSQQRAAASLTGSQIETEAAAMQRCFQGGH